MIASSPARQDPAGAYARGTFATRDHYRHAVEQLARAYALAHDPEIAAHWGEALWKSGNQAEARRVWAAALARNPDSDELKGTVARLIPAGKK